jgi:hypothetical protein
MITESIKKLVGEELALKVEEALRGKGKDGKDVDVVVGNDGSFVPAAKYDEEKSSAASNGKLVNDIAEFVKEYGGSGDVKSIKKDLETAIEKMKRAAENETVALKREYALKEIMRQEGVIDCDYLIYKQGGVDKFSFDNDNKPIGVSDILKGYKESLPHIFKAEEKVNTSTSKQVYSPIKWSDPQSNPWAKETFNLTKQGELFRENPAQAREMASQVGIEI